jgi:mRNA interferase YafQ
MDEFRTVIQLLERDGRLPEVYRPHMLHGDRQDQWECHIQPDWLLIWKQKGNELELLMLNNRHTLRLVRQEQEVI